MKRIAFLSLAIALTVTVGVIQVTDDAVLAEPQPDAVITTVCTEPPTKCHTELLTELPTETTVEVTEPHYEIVINEYEAIALARMAWGEARGCDTMEIAATMWCVLNRVDAWGGTVLRVVTAPSQFHGYSKKHPVEDHLYDLAVDVLTRWQMEKQGASPEEVGRVLPPQYLYFHGDGRHNHFRTHYKHKKATYWDWSYPNPYETEVS